MKYLVISLLALTLFVAGSALAGNAAADAAKAPKKAIELKHGTSKRMHVLFRHDTHKAIACEQCHHDSPSAEKPFAACTDNDCHATPGPRERDTMSMFVAYHAKDTDRSCYGCHKKMAATQPGFSGCRPCHMSPQARKEAATVAKKK